MLKHIVVVAVLFSGTVLSLVGLESIALAQEVPVCFITNPSGQLIDLSEICLRQEQALSSEKKVRGLYEQAVSLAQKGLFKEAVEKLNQVVNINNKSPQAYAFRGTMRLGAGNSQAALTDLKNALELYKAAGNLKSSRIIQQQINAIQD